MQLLVICNPENRRIEFLRQAATTSGWTIKPVAYENLLAGSVDLANEVRDCDAVRIDSPGENFLVERRLLARGAGVCAELGYQSLEPNAALRLEYELGRIHFPWQYFLGFKSLLENVAERLSGKRFMNSPQAVVTMFDKVATSDCFHAQGIPTPFQLGLVSSFEQLRDLLVVSGRKRVFVKLTTGSSASGVVAIVRHGEHFRATTTVETVVTANGKLELYNSLKLRHLSNTRELSRLIDSLVPHRIFAEEWLPKASYDHHSTFDVRVLVVNGIATHFVPRVSSSPMTNLHLGNRRGEWIWIKQRLGANLAGFLQTSSQAARAIPDVFYSGLDVIVDPTLSKFHVLEANACGDLLPGIVNSSGEDTYQVQLTGLKRQIECDG